MTRFVNKNKALKEIFNLKLNPLIRRTLNNRENQKKGLDSRGKMKGSD
jgi:hypothetical protein